MERRKAQGSHYQAGHRRVVQLEVTHIFLWRGSAAHPGGSPLRAAQQHSGVALSCAAWQQSQLSTHQAWLLMQGAKATK